LCEKSPEYKKVEKYQSIPTRLMGFFLHFGKKLLKRGGERAPNGGGTSFGNPEPLAERGDSWDGQRICLSA
jgi:hypothetical protein